jgi:formylglycine-generating enzyme required for sulfatase activity
MRTVIFVWMLAIVLGACSRRMATLSWAESHVVGADTIPPDHPPQTHSFRDCPDRPEMVGVPAGSFTMGSPADEPGRDGTEGPQRQVKVRQFAAGKFDVTRGQWAAFLSATNRSVAGGCAWAGPSSEKLDPQVSWRKLSFPQDDKHPVVCVTWQDAQDYVHWLSQRTGDKYRLLSEAEWEYAARGRTSTAYPWGPKSTHEHANYGADKCCSGLAAGRDRWEQTSPVGAFPPNAFGLYDMHGNVLQWVQDCFAASYSGLPADGSAYEEAVVLNTAGPFPWFDMSGTNACSYRMVRGGDWGDTPSMIRSASRNFWSWAGSDFAKLSQRRFGVSGCENP